jgi:hypothetical protein
MASWGAGIVELPCRFCGALFPREFNEGFIDETGRYHFIVGPAGILSEEQNFDGGRRRGRKRQRKKKIVVERIESELEESNHDGM